MPFQLRCNLVFDVQPVFTMQSFIVSDTSDRSILTNNICVERRGKTLDETYGTRFSKETIFEAWGNPLSANGQLA